MDLGFTSVDHNGGRFFARSFHVFTAEEVCGYFGMLYVDGFIYERAELPHQTEPAGPPSPRIIGDFVFLHRRANNADTGESGWFSAKTVAKEATAYRAYQAAKQLAEEVLKDLEVGNAT